MAEGGQARHSVVGDVMPTSSLPGNSIALVKDVGGNVELNVSDHGKIEINQTTQNCIPPCHEDISPRKLIQICNDNTKDLTAIGVLDDFRHAELQEPNFIVYPRMRQVNVNEFYNVHYANSKYKESSSEDHQYNQLTREVGFLRQDQTVAETIGFDDVVVSIWQRENIDTEKTVGVTAIVASAGSGKSTLTRRIARHALCISSAGNEGLPSYGEKMVHYIELKDSEKVDEITPSKFLFGGMYENEIQEGEAFKWLVDHQSEAVLIFDGLDQAMWNFKKNPRRIKRHEKASSWTVMYNILSRNILRHVKVFIASREFKISELPDKAHPETIITLNGLTLKHAQKLFVNLLEEKGEILWQKIETLSPRLLNLVSVPVFLILVAVLMGRDPSKPPPTTVTELFKRIISALQSVKNIRSWKEILKIVHKLKELAFYGMKEGRVVFKETDLEQFGVSANEVTDLITKVPGKNLLGQHLMTGDFRFYFCHQSMQEYLAASFVTEMKLEEFTDFDEEYLHKPRWSIVRQFVTGIVFSKSQNDIYKVSDQTRKQQLLARSFCSQHQEKLRYGRFENHTRMDLYAAIYEADDDTLMKQHSVVDVSHISLRRDQAHIVGSLVARNQSLDSLNLCNCGINDELLCIIARCFIDSVRVKRVDLWKNNLSATALRSLLGHCRIESLSGNLYWEDSTLSGGAAREPEFLEILFDTTEYDVQRQLWVKPDNLRKT